MTAVLGPFRSRRPAPAAPATPALDAIFCSEDVLQTLHGTRALAGLVVLSHALPSVIPLPIVGLVGPSQRVGLRPIQNVAREHQILSLDPTTPTVPEERGATSIMDHRDDGQSRAFFHALYRAQCVRYGVRRNQAVLRCLDLQLPVLDGCGGGSRSQHRQSLTRWSLQNALLRDRGLLPVLELCRAVLFPAGGEEEERTKDETASAHLLLDLRGNGLTNGAIEAIADLMLTCVAAEEQLFCPLHVDLRANPGLSIGTGLVLIEVARAAIGTPRSSSQRPVVTVDLRGLSNIPAAMLRSPLSAILHSGNGVEQLMP